MGMMFCIIILTALLVAAVLIKITFCMLRLVWLVFLPIVMLVLLPVGVVCMLLAILGLITLPIMLPFLLIKRLVF